MSTRIHPRTKRASAGLIRGFIVGTGVAFGLSAGFAQAPVSNSAVAVWDFSARAEVDTGYRENVLRSAVSQENSGYVSGSGDISLIRLSDPGSEFSLFIFGQDLEYFDAPSVDSERFASATAAYLRPISPAGTLGLEANYLYQNQVVDVSENEATLRRILVEGHSFGLKPRWEHELGLRWNLTVEAAAQRQLYLGELDDYWEPSAHLALKHEYGNRSDITLGVTSGLWLYDSRLETDSTGADLEGTSLVYWRPEVLLQWRHYWDEARCWRSLMKLSGLGNRDSGSGYFDYDRVSLRKSIRWISAPWEVTAGGRATWYDYHEQRVDGELRRRSYYVADMRVDRAMGRRWFVYLSGEHEWDVSNDPLDEYRTWAVWAGLGRDF